MLDQNWDQVERIFLEAADLPPAEREVYLERECGGSAELRRQVEGMLAADDEGIDAVEAAIQSEAATVFDDELSLVNTFLGPYRILEEIGHGGMGTVYLAERADDQYHKRVAIKVVRRGMDTREVLDRFRHERQILAGLEHSYIARLIDGGTTPDGRPFFVMEHVEGQPIDTHCRDRGLDVESILRLFLKVCEAVAHAHHALVVHRDLKPGNIFVNREGVPKLLDFGVAKLLRPDASAGVTVTAAGVGPLTPEYASPEQVRGLPVTTATDVYALGAILFELLTGTRAQRIDTLTPQEIDRVVCETQPPRPSTLARAAGKPRLNSDLDNIVAMAMRKERERRYSSVEQLGGDIRRYLEGRPVGARQDSLSYRAGKFVRRNRWGVAAAGLLLATLLGGVTVSVAQARRAEAARQVAELRRQEAEALRKSAEAERARAESQTRVVETERDRSERRLVQMVDLADRSLYDVHSAIEKLPGAIEARRKIVASTLQFLEKLSKDAGQDDRLRFVLAGSYIKVADVQGYPLFPNLGQTDAAVVSYGKALELLRPLLAKNPDNAEYILSKVRAEVGRNAVLLTRGNERELARGLSALLPMARRLVKLCPKDWRCLTAEAGVRSALVEITNKYDTQAALDNVSRQVELLEYAARVVSADTNVQNELANAYSQQAKALNSRGRIREAVEPYRKSIAIRERLLARNPQDVILRRSLMITYGNMGGNLGHPNYQNLGDTPGAIAAYKRALSIARELAADPADKLGQSDLAQALRLYASLDLPREEYRESLAMLRESEAIFTRLAGGGTPSLGSLTALSMVQVYAGKRLEALGDSDGAMVYFRKSVLLIEDLMARSPSSLNLVSQGGTAGLALVEILARQGKGEEALAVARRSLANFEKVSAPEAERERMRSYAARQFVMLATAQGAVGNWTESRASAERALRELQQSGTYFRKSEAEKAEALLRESAARLR